MKLLRPIRETVSTIVGRENLGGLWLLTFAFATVANVIYWSLVSRLDRRRLVSWSLHGCALCTLGFFGGFLWLEGEGENSSSALLYGFYAWYSAFAMCVTSLFWVCMVDQLDADDGKRWFGRIAVGGTLGGMFGSKLAGWIAAAPGDLAVASLFLAAAAAIELAVLCNAWRERVLRRKAEDLDRGTSQPRATECLGSTPPARAGVWTGLKLCITEPRLRWFALFVLLMTGAQTAFYLVQVDVVSEHFPDRTDRVVYYADKELLTDGLTLLLQGLVSGWILRRFGVTLAISFVALIAVVGTTALANTHSLTVLFLVHASWDAGRHGLLRPAREVLFTPLSKAAKFRSKTFLDSVLYRGSDVVWAQLLGTLTVAATAVLAIPLALAWVPIAVRLGRGIRTEPHSGEAPGEG